MKAAAGPIDKLQQKKESRKRKEKAGEKGRQQLDLSWQVACEEQKKEKKTAKRWEEIFGGSWRKRKEERREKGKKEKEERNGRKWRRKSRNFIKCSRN
jgi:hypothetical protein